MKTKIFSLPKEYPAPEIDFKNYNKEKKEENEKKHIEELKKFLIQSGYNKPLTGEIFRSPIADGYAQYMFFDAGKEWGLIHLPYGDAYNNPDVEFLTKSEIKKRIEASKKLKSVISNSKKSKFQCK